MWKKQARHLLFSSTNLYEQQYHCCNLRGANRLQCINSSFKRSSFFRLKKAIVFLHCIEGNFIWSSSWAWVKLLCSSSKDDCLPILTLARFTSGKCSSPSSLIWVIFKILHANWDFWLLSTSVSSLIVGSAILQRYVYIKNKMSGLSRVCQGSGSTRLVDRVSPGQLPNEFLLRPGPVPCQDRPGPGSTRWAGPGFKTMPSIALRGFEPVIIK